jgi:hypothetical protein
VIFDVYTENGFRHGLYDVVQQYKFSLNNLVVSRYPYSRFGLLMIGRPITVCVTVSQHIVSEAIETVYKYYYQKTTASPFKYTLS